MKKIIFSLVLLVGLCKVYAQSSRLITVYVIDSLSNNYLPEAALSYHPIPLKIQHLTNKTILKVPDEAGKLEVSLLGYYSKSIFVKNSGDTTVYIHLNQTTFLKNELVVEATRSATSIINTEVIDRRKISEINTGQDIPFVLQQFTSVTSSSDAGNGIGYTSFSIRGSDASRVNVTLNGITLNDAESHGQFFVNLPDFINSADEISIQKGLGSVVNGVASFGANVNIQTGFVKTEPYAILSSSFGSFNSFGRSIKLGTGLLKNKFTFDARLSGINSDGYIDRAFSYLKGGMLTGTWTYSGGLTRMSIIDGAEKTYQAWNGVPEDSLKYNRTYNMFTYPNQTDNYRQTHYQFVSFKQAGNYLLNLTLHYTKGKGYYEEYKSLEDVSLYNLPPFINGADTILNFDLVRRRWLDNDFYGAMPSVTRIIEKGKNSVKIVVGAGANNYEGSHFGEVIWANYMPGAFLNTKYYQNNSLKSDLNSFTKIDFNANAQYIFSAELQYRIIQYSYYGFGENLMPGQQKVKYKFFNPRFSVTRISSHSLLKPYFFYGIGNREPVRSDFTDSSPGSRPLPEKMHNAELGFKINEWKNFYIHFNAYYQYYLNQLVLTGKINDVGAYSRTNTPYSYRGGLEGNITWKFRESLSLGGNFNLSRNKISSFNYFVDDYDIGTQREITLKNTDMALSPSATYCLFIHYQLLAGTKLSLMHKYVSNQYLDNTMNDDRKINSYNFTNVRLDWSHQYERVKIGLWLNAHNIFNHLYATSGYTYSYIYGGNLTTENFYFPQAGINFMSGFTLGF